MAITIFDSELSSGGEKKLASLSGNMSPHHHYHHHRHHHRHNRPKRRRSTLISLPNTMWETLYKLWTTICCLGTRIEDSTTKIFPSGKPVPFDKQDRDGSANPTDDSDDELLLNRESSYHSGLVTRAYLPMRLTLMVLGRWPFLLILQSVNTRNSESKLVRKIRILNYDPSLKSFAWIYFGLTTLFIFFVLVMSSLGFLDFYLEWKLFANRQWAAIQSHTFRNNLVMFLLVWGCLVHSTLSSFSMFIGRKRVTRTLNFWNVAAEELQLGDVSRHRRFLIFANLGYVVFLVLIYFAYSWWNVRFVRDGATLFGTLAILPLLNEYQWNGIEEWMLRVFGILMIMYCVYASRAFLFMFCFECRLLRSLFKVYNERLVNFLRSSEILDGSDKGEMEKLESRLLIRDIGILLKMVRQTDEAFATILLSYYAIQLVNMCFELFMLAKSGTDDFSSGNECNRSLDIISALITLLQNVYFFFTVSLDGAAVGEEALEGYEAIRRHPITPHSSQHKKYLVYSMGFIYNQKIVLTAGKFFPIDRPFIITMLGSVLTYFVIILQVFRKSQKDAVVMTNSSLLIDTSVVHI